VRAGGRTDRQTDVTKLIVAFRNFANAHNNEENRVSFCAYVLSEELLTKVLTKVSLQLKLLTFLTFASVPVTIYKTGQRGYGNLKQNFYN
jgi:hypothetical protein